ncbi:ribosome 60S biogenesis N-terminal-domain-containing protein, partial [Cristinia sonorae]
GLNSLRNQFTVKYDERVSVTDERLILLQAWLDHASAARELFGIWERTTSRQQALQSAIVSLLSAILTLLSSHYSLQPLAAPIVNSLLSSQWLPKLNAYLASTHRDLVLFTLKLFNSLSLYGGGQERRLILEGFAWESKSLFKLLNMRRKGGESKNILAFPDIRSLFILFLISFVDVSTSSSIKAAFLEQRRDTFTSIFKGLSEDPYPLARRVLEVCWSGIWSDQKVKRTLKVAVFQETTISHIAKLYERREPEGGDSEDIPADLAHHFFLAICTTPGVGICFRDRGWYPRESGDANTEEPTRKASGNLYNRILGNILNGLKVNEDSRQQELAYRILKACPELVAGYWAGSSLTLEPRLSSKWIANIAFLGSVISQPVPLATFKLPGNQDMYNPSPPAVTTIVENILPSTNIKTHLSRGLKSSSALVQHCTALALIKCLTKYHAVINAFQTVETVLNEGDNGRWSGRRMDVEREVRRRVPELQVVLAFAQQKGHDVLQTPVVPPTDGDNAPAPSTNLARNALLLECAQRLLWLYHRLLPILVSEARFDVGKLLHTTYAAESAKSSDVTTGVDTLRHLHVLRLLQASDQFSWSAKTGAQGNLGILLKFYVGSRSSAIRSAIQSLLEHTLSTSLLFQHDLDEVSLWLDSLSPTAANEEPSSEDNGVNTVIEFLDECSQRFMKTPYRYIEEQRALLLPTDAEMGEDESRPLPTMEQPETCPSPLLMVLFEQVFAKLGAQKSTHIDILTVVRFLRRLLLRLASKVPSLVLLRSFVGRFQSGSRLDDCSPSKTDTLLSIQEEIQGLTLNLSSLEGSGDAAYPSIEEFTASVAMCSSQQLRQFTCLLHFSSDFLAAFVKTSNTILTNESSRQILLDTLRPDAVRSIAIKRALTLVNHRLLACTQNDRAQGDLLFLASSVFTAAKGALSREDVLALEQFVLQLASIKACAVQPLTEHNRLGLSDLLRQLLDPHNEQDRSLVGEHTAYWSQIVMEHGLDGDKGATALLWLRYMNHNQLWSFIDFLGSGHSLPNEPLLKAVTEVLVTALPEALAQSDAADHLQKLVRLQSVLQGSNGLEPMISLAINSQLPPIDPTGFKSSHSSGESITAALAFGRKHKGIKKTHSAIDISPFLSTATWTTHTQRIVVDLLYTQSNARPQVLSWIRENVKTCSAENLATVLLAIVDSASSTEELAGEDTQFLLTACSRLFKALKEGQDRHVQKTSSASLCHLARNIPSIRSGLIRAAIKGCRSLKQGAISLAILQVAATLQSCCAIDAAELVQVVLDHSWTWAVDTLSQNEVSAETYGMLKVMGESALAQNTNDIKGHLVEPVITVALQEHLSHSEVLEFIRQVVGIVPLKPAVVNKHLQLIVQHPKLYDLCGSSIRDSELRLSIIKLLHTLFHLHPTNTCQPSHVLPIVPLYGGTLSPFDRKLLCILRLFESTRKTSAAVFLKARGTSDDRQALNAILLLDPNVIFRTCANFPQWRSLDIDTGEESQSTEDALYDPVYVLLIFAQFLADGATSAALVWVQVFRTNVVSLILRALSSPDGAIRSLALAQIAGLYKSLQDTDMVEKPHVIHILNLLKDQYRPSTSSDAPDRLPTYTTLHLAHSLRGVFYPSQFTYPLTARHLLQRPELDTSDVPMLYATLYSSGDDWKRDRAWMVRFLGDGMVGRAEWKVLKRRHTWDLVASQFQGTTDRAFRQGAMKLLANITSKPFTIIQLVLKSSLLIWMEAQLEDLRAGEELAWLKVLENIIVLADKPKLDAATNDEWYQALGRCILAVLKRTTLHVETLFHALQATLRLTLLRPQNAQLSAIFTSSLSHMEAIEETLPQSGEFVKPASSPANPPHTGQDLFRPLSDDHIMWWYGQCVETLWRIAISLPTGTDKWDSLTYKLLVWREYVGEENSPIGEWARKEVVRNLT